MKRSTWLKITRASLLAALAAASLIIPALAIIGGTEINVSSLGAGSPDIEVSSDGQFIAMAYYKQASGDGAVFVKSSTASDGWVTASLVGFGSDPQLAFSNVSNNVVYVVWRKSGGTAIQSAQCNLSPTNPPNCTVGTDVKTVSANQLNFPDIVVDGSGFIHVAWQNNTNQTTTIIETARSGAANSLASWPTVVPAASSNHNQKPVLAQSSSQLHLAFLNGTSTAAPTSVQYRRSGTGSHSWGAPASFVIGGGIVNSHDKLDNPTIAASGSNVYLAWDARRGSGSNDFSLIHSTSTNNGTSWNNPPTYVPSNGPANVTQPSEIKSASNLPLPPQEVGLRPSVAISSTNAAIVWQEIPGQVGCFNVDPFNIFLANPLTGAGSDRLSNAGDDDSMIDPDLAVGTGGVRHFVYMRDIDGSCPGGPASDYLITYRGPFTITTNDRGEGGGIFLPLILKD